MFLFAAATITVARMLTSFTSLLLVSISLSSVGVRAECYDPTPAFPPPKLDAKDQIPILLDAFQSLEDVAESIANDESFNTTSFSIEVTSAQSTLWSYHHTAKVLNETRPGANPVRDDSFYRIASITKTFTTLALLKQAAAGNLNIDDPINKYLPNLEGPIPWKDITLRTLASQISGIPRDWSQGDILTELTNPTDFGLPPPNNTHLPNCYGFNESFAPCTESDLYSALAHSKPLFPPGQQSTYSNTNFELLGLVLANVTGLAYEDVIDSTVLAPLGISATGATFTSPPDHLSVLPAGIQYYHDVDEGIHNPTGGLFMSTSAMSVFLRHVLSIFNSPPTLSLQAGNWFTPHSFTASTKSFYGMPWEIFRPDTILHSSRRAVTMMTKGGGLPGYITNIILIPEYELCISIFAAGNGEIMSKLREEITVSLINAAEKVATQQMVRRYAGTFTNEHINSSLTLRYTQSKGLVIDTWISNSTNVLQKFAAVYPQVLKPGVRAQLIPTLLFVDEERRRGERWRIILVQARAEDGDGQNGKMEKGKGRGGVG